SCCRVAGRGAVCGRTTTASTPPTATCSPDGCAPRATGRATEPVDAPGSPPVERPCVPGSRDGYATSPGASTPPRKEPPMSKVAFLLGPDFEDREFSVPRDAVIDAGHEAVVIGPDAGKE